MKNFQYQRKEAQLDSFDLNCHTLKKKCFMRNLPKRKVDLITQTTVSL